MTEPTRDDKRRANKAVVTAKASGRLGSPSLCEACNAIGAKLVYHHWSYLPEHHLDVIPMCVRCHRQVHHGIIPEPRTGRVYQFVRKTSPLDWNPIVSPRWARKIARRMAKAEAVRAVANLTGKTGLTPTRQRLVESLENAQVRDALRILALVHPGAAEALYG